jgi:hypothetical protein
MTKRRGRTTKNAAPKRAATAKKAAKPAKAARKPAKAKTARPAGGTDDVQGYGLYPVVRRITIK